MKRVFFYIFIAAGIMTAGCTKNEISEIRDNVKVEGELTFVAQTDNSSDTKTTLDGLDIKWVAADPVMIFGKDGESNPKVSGYAAGNAGASSTLDWTTSISGTEGAFVTGETPEYALYPADASNASINGSTITFKLPEIQTYAANSFGPGANVSVGKISSLEDIATITFKNVCGYLKLQISVAEGDAATVGKIILTTKGEEKLWGTFEADASLDTPVATYKAGATDGSNSVTLNCPEGVVVSSDASNPTAFYIVVPVGALADGFKAEVYSNRDHLMTTLETTKAVTIVRNQVNRMANKSFNWIPLAYTETFYVQTSGEVWVKTGFCPVSQKIQGTFKINLSNPIGPDHFTVSGRSESARERYDTFGSWKGDNSQTIKVVANTVNIESGVKYSPNETYVIDGVIEKTSARISVNGGAYKTGNPGGFLPNGLEFYLFAINKFGTPFQIATGKLYYAKYYAEDIVARYFIPAYVTSVGGTDDVANNGSSTHADQGTVGLFDITNRKFYINNGTGSLVYPTEYSSIDSNNLESANKGAILN